MCIIVVFCLFFFLRCACVCVFVSCFFLFDCFVLFLCFCLIVLLVFCVCCCFVCFLLFGFVWFSNRFGWVSAKLRLACGPCRGRTLAKTRMRGCKTTETQGSKKDRPPGGRFFWAPKQFGRGVHCARHVKILIRYLQGTLNIQYSLDFVHL